MEFFIPILFAVIKKSIAALLVAAFIFLARRCSDYALGIDFKKEWSEASEKTKFTFINTRYICITALFCLTFTLA